MRAVRFVLNSCILFWSYTLIGFLARLILQTPLRMIGIAADTRAEYLWQTVVMYAIMLVVCVGHLLLRNAGQKVDYFRAVDNRPWDLREAVTYVLRNPDFWENSIGFAVWPLLFPKLFNTIHLLYVSRTTLETFPKPLLALLTVSMPFVLFSFAAWLLILYRWNVTRMHK